MNFLRIFFFLLCICFACNNPVQVSVEERHNFETEKYFMDEAAMLQSKNTGIIKTLFKNDSTQIIHTKNVNWKNELDPFIKINLNKPALANSFYIDTMLQNSSTIIHYKAIEPTLELRDLKIYLSKNKTDSVKAVMESSNLYYSAVDSMIYYGNGKYRISVWNKPRLGKEVKFILEGIPEPGNTEVKD